MLRIFFSSSAIFISILRRNLNITSNYDVSYEAPEERVLGGNEK